MTKEKLQKNLDFLPLIILTISAINLIWIVSNTESSFMWKHIVGLALLIINYFLFFKNHKLGVIALGITIIIGMLSLLSFNPIITTTTFGIAIKGSVAIPLFYGQTNFILWLIIHFIISGRYYFGVLKLKYWQDLMQEIKSK